jgi:hypothetical protein
MQHATGQMTQHRTNTATHLTHNIQIQVVGTTGAVVHGSNDTVVKVYWNDDLVGTSKVEDILDWNPLATQQVSRRPAQRPCCLVFTLPCCLVFTLPCCHLSLRLQVEANAIGKPTYDVPMPSDMLSVSYSLAFEVRASCSLPCQRIELFTFLFEGPFWSPWQAFPWHGVT